jgi:DNA-binding protein YbaB
VGLDGGGLEHEALGDLTRVRRIVKILGMVNAAPDFVDPPKVVNGASDLIVAALNDAHRKADEAMSRQMQGLMGGMKIPGLS